MKFTKTKLLFLLSSIFLGSLLLSLTIGENIIENKQPTLESFVLIHFLGHLFFLLMPLEGVYIYYLSEGLNPIILACFAIFTGIMGQIINYFIGYCVPEKYLVELVGDKKYQKRKKFIHKYTNLMVLLFSLSILSSPIIVLIAGIVKCKFEDVAKYSIIGLSIKYIIITLFYSIFWI